VDVSVIIVNWNTKDLLQNCIESVYQQAGDIQYEIIVVDNASSDGSAGMVTKNFQHVTLIRNSQNRGFAAANNQGMAIAKGRYVLLLNSDTVVLDGGIAKTVSFADTDPQAAVVGCRVLNPDTTLQPTCFMFPSLLNLFLSSTYLYKLFPNGKFFGREQMTWWSGDEAREVDVVSGCFMLVRRKAIELVGMMDAQYFMYAEETDWCYRFKKAGLKVVFAPVAQIIHFKGASTVQRSADMVIQLRLSILRFFRKHHCAFVYGIACLLTALFFAIRVPAWLFIGLLGRKRHAEAAVKTRAYLTGIRKILFRPCSS